MKHLFTAAAMLLSMTAFAQVGINNTSPKATLDITAKTTDGSKPEGLIIPQLSGSNIHTATAAGVYGTNQKGLIIYATSADSSPISTTANITAAGYYYFDGTNWQKVVTGSVANSDMTTGVGGIYKGSGSLSGNTTVTQGANTLAFTSTATNGFSVDGTTLSVDAANNRVGMGTSTPLAPLHISATTTSDHLRMTNTDSDWALSSENAGTPNGISGKASFTIIDRANSIRRMTIGTDNSVRLGGDISSGTAAFSIDGATNNVGIGTNIPNTNAALDVSSTTKGVKLPSLSLTATNSASPLSAHVVGMLVYNTATAGTAPNNVVPGLYTNDGTQWILLQTPQTVNVSAPAGTVSYTAASTVPTGYLECNGAAVSRTTYATLFAAIGTTYGAGDGSTT
ncbi:MAG: phage tail protein, partial [Chryseobacterium sp.]